jgi:hypothetical protein
VEATLNGGRRTSGGELRWLAGLLAIYLLLTA